MSDLPANAATTAVLNQGEVFTDTLNFRGDKDWVRLDLAAGEWVRVTQRGVGDDALHDALLRIYDPQGNLITVDDELDRSMSNLDASAIFGGGPAGTYFVEAASYNNRSSGDYSLVAHSITAPAGSPVQTLSTGTKRTDTHVSVHFVRAGEQASFGRTTSQREDDIRSEGWNAYEQQQFRKALDSIAAVTNIKFSITNDRNADFQVVLDTNELNNNGLLGYFYLPDGARASVGVFNANGQGWDRSPGGGLEVGGLGYATMVHELLHGLGLGHPHDSSRPMSNIEIDFNDLGPNGLNQGIYSTMSYNGGYATTPSHHHDYGNEAGPMVLDVAALQALYGVNRSHATGNNVYTITDDATAGGWQTIWDAGGTDRIAYAGSADVVIDLRPATLTYDIGGGGYVSAVDGIASGYTIAAGVTIEEGIAGAGDDYLVANDAGNFLNGGDGLDILHGGAGHDRLLGGADNDFINGRAGNDTIDGGAGAGLLIGGAGNDVITGGTVNDVIHGNAGADQITTTAGTNVLNGHGGSDQISGGADVDVIDGGTGDDTIYAGADDDLLIGGRGADVLDGGAGDDQISGGWGADDLTGGTGADVFIFDFLSDSSAVTGQSDMITDFETGVDLIDLQGIDADRDVLGNQSLLFIGDQPFDGAAQLRTEVMGNDIIVQVDRNGDGFAEMAIILADITTVSQSDFIL